MQVLNREYYAAWRDIHHDGIRYWIRLWQDGFHSGSHPEWSFNPLTLTGLGLLWRLFVSQPGEPDWGRPQRHAIRILAARRAGFPDGKRFPCPTVEGDGPWNEYWSAVLAARTAFRDELFEQLLKVVVALTDPPNFSGISETTATLAAELLLEGYSDYELFVRAGGVFDPKGKQTLPHIERAKGLIAHLQRKPTSEFVVWTDVLRNGQMLSGTTSRRLARLELQGPEDWKGGDGFARIGDGAKAITRTLATHSITAFLDHRVSAWQRLRERATKYGLTGLALAEESSVRQLSLPDRQPWKHTLPRTTPFHYLPRPDSTIESEAFAAAIEAVNDDPEEVVRLLADAFERQLGTDWPRSAGRAYIGGLRAALARRLTTVVQETHDRWDGHSDAPTWLGRFSQDERLDFAKVAAAIRESGQHADWLLAQRFDSVGRNSTQYFTPAWITGWLYLAKGIRNREVHAGSWPPTLRCVAAFLARVLLCVFVGSFPRPEPMEPPDEVSGAA